MVGFGIIGCGAISQAHIESILKIPDAKLVAVWNRTPDKAKATAEKYGCDWYVDLDEMLARPDIHVVNICTASGAHLEPGLKAARAGKHVMVEKPLEITPERCDALIQACEEAGVKLATVFPSRFGKAAPRVHEAALAGEFGRLVFGGAAVPWWRSQAYYDQGGWRGTWALDGGGALMNQSIHQIDLLQWIMGPVAQIQAYTACLAHERIEVEDTAVAILRFKSGALGIIQGTTSIYPGFATRVEICGDKGSAIIVNGSLSEWHTRSGETEVPADLKQQVSRGAASDPMAISFVNHQRQIEDMIRAIREDRAPACDGHEGKKSVEIICGIYRAAQTGAPVNFD